MTTSHINIFHSFPLIDILLLLPIWILLFSYSIKMKVLEKIKLPISRKFLLWVTNIFDYTIITLIILLTSLVKKEKQLNLDSFSQSFLLLMLILLIILIYFASLIKILRLPDLKIPEIKLFKVMNYPILIIGSISVLINFICSN